MTITALQFFCNRVVEAGLLTRADVQALTRDILPDGLADRDQADLLLALDRAVAAHESFADALVVLTVDFAVWGERPTGTIDHATAAWLAASIRGRSGPTPTGARIAREIVREAVGCDEALLAFALDANARAHRTAAEERPGLGLAA